VKFSRILYLTKRSNPERWPILPSLSSGMSVFVLSLILLVGAASQLGAQSVSSGDIVGVVTDPSGAVLSNASVTLKSQESGSTQAQSTNSRGMYRFSTVAARALHGLRGCYRFPRSQGDGRGDHRASHDR